MGKLRISFLKSLVLHKGIEPKPANSEVDHYITMLLIQRFCFLEAQQQIVLRSELAYF